MKLHPAAKIAKAMARLAGFDAYYVGTLSIVLANPRHEIERPVIVDVIPHGEDYRLDVCWLFDSNSQYQAARDSLHGQIIRVPE